MNKAASVVETREWTTPQGLRLVGEVAGPEGAPLVVLLHGGGQTRHSWAGAMARLVEAGYRVINYDARGHGQSDWCPEGRYRLSDRVEDLATVVDGIDQPIGLVGASLGGATALCAVAAGVRAEAVVMVDIVPDAEAEGIDHIRQFMRSGADGFGSLDEVADAVAAYNPERPRPSDPAGLMKNLRHGPEGRLHWHWDPRILDDGDHAREAMKAASLSLARSGAPSLLVVRGVKSDVVSDAGVAAFRAILPDIEVADVASAGHMVAGDRNDAFNQAVLGFLGRVLSPEPC